MIFFKDYLLGRAEIDGTKLEGEDLRLDYLDVLRWIRYTYNQCPSLQYLVWEFNKTPELLRKYCCFNGGDEDYLVICKNVDGDILMDRIDRCGNLDSYEIEEYIIFVTSHA